MILAAPSIVHRSFVVCEGAGSPVGSAVPVFLDRDVRINPKQVAEYCARDPEPIDLDLLTVAGAVRFADLSTRRTPDWSREIQLSVPVHDPDAWSAAAPQLAACLSFVTGDQWSFEFHARRRPVETQARPIFDQPAPGVVIPYSGGLDSFLHLVLRAAEKPSSVWLLTAEHSNRTGSLVARTVAKTGINVQNKLRIPIRFGRTEREPEPTNRTRTFLFFVCAAIAWKLSGADSVEIAENGQGAVGPSLVWFGREHRYVSSHPAFTATLADFLHCLWGKRPVFAHPRVWQTKGEVLTMAAAGDLPAWEDSRSCSRHPRRLKYKFAQSMSARDCGICGGCLLRRLAAHAAGQRDTTTYLWDRLGVNRLEKAPRGRECRAMTTLNDRRMAVASVLCLSRLADAAEWSDERLLTEARRLSRALEVSSEDALGRLKRLVGSHAAEWRSLSSTLPADSWVRLIESGCA